MLHRTAVRPRSTAKDVAATQFRQAFQRARVNFDTFYVRKPFAEGRVTWTLTDNLEIILARQISASARLEQLSNLAAESSMALVGSSLRRQAGAAPGSVSNPNPNDVERLRLHLLGKNPIRKLLNAAEKEDWQVTVIFEPLDTRQWRCDVHIHDLWSTTPHWRRSISSGADDVNVSANSIDGDLVGSSTGKGFVLSLTDACEDAAKAAEERCEERRRAEIRDVVETLRAAHTVPLFPSLSSAGRAASCLKGSALDLGALAMSEAVEGAKMFSRGDGSVEFRVRTNVGSILCRSEQQPFRERVSPNNSSEWRRTKECSDGMREAASLLVRHPTMRHFTPQPFASRDDSLMRSDGLIAMATAAIDYMTSSIGEVKEDSLLDVSELLQSGMTPEEVLSVLEGQLRDLVSNCGDPNQADWGKEALSRIAAARCTIAPAPETNGSDGVSLPEEETATINNTKWLSRYRELILMYGGMSQFSVTGIPMRPAFFHSTLCSEGNLRGAENVQKVHKCAIPINGKFYSAGTFPVAGGPETAAATAMEVCQRTFHEAFALMESQDAAMAVNGDKELARLAAHTESEMMGMISTIVTAADSPTGEEQQQKQKHNGGTNGSNGNTSTIMLELNVPMGPVASSSSSRSGGQHNPLNVGIHRAGKSDDDPWGAVKIVVSSGNDKNTKGAKKTKIVSAPDGCRQTSALAILRPAIELAEEFCDSRDTHQKRRQGVSLTFTLKKGLPTDTSLQAFLTCVLKGMKWLVGDGKVFRKSVPSLTVSTESRHRIYWVPNAGPPILLGANETSLTNALIDALEQNVFPVLDLLDDGQGSTAVRSAIAPLLRRQDFFDSIKGSGEMGYLKQRIDEMSGEHCEVRVGEQASGDGFAVSVICQGDSPGKTTTFSREGPALFVTANEALFAAAVAVTGVDEDTLRFEASKNQVSIPQLVLDQGKSLGQQPVSHFLMARFLHNAAGTRTEAMASRSSETVSDVVIAARDLDSGEIRTLRVASAMSDIGVRYARHEAALSCLRQNFPEGTKGLDALVAAVGVIQHPTTAARMGWLNPPAFTFSTKDAEKRHVCRVVCSDGASVEASDPRSANAFQAAVDKMLDAVTDVDASLGDLLDVATDYRIDILAKSGPSNDGGSSATRAGWEAVGSSSDPSPESPPEVTPSLRKEWELRLEEEGIMTHVKVVTSVPAFDPASAATKWSVGSSAELVEEDEVRTKSVRCATPLRALLHVYGDALGNRHGVEADAASCWLRVTEEWEGPANLLVCRSFAKDVIGFDVLQNAKFQSCANETSALLAPADGFDNVVGSSTPTEFVELMPRIQGSKKELEDITPLLWSMWSLGAPQLIHRHLLTVLPHVVPKKVSGGVCGLIRTTICILRSFVEGIIPEGGELSDGIIVDEKTTPNSLTLVFEGDSVPLATVARPEDAMKLPAAVLELHVRGLAAMLGRAGFTPDEFPTLIPRVLQAASKRIVSVEGSFSHPLLGAETNLIDMAERNMRRVFGPGIQLKFSVGPLSDYGSASWCGNVKVSAAPLFGSTVARQQKKSDDDGGENWLFLGENVVSGKKRAAMVALADDLLRATFPTMMSQASSTRRMNDSFDNLSRWL